MIFSNILRKKREREKMKKSSRKRRINEIDRKTLRSRLKIRAIITFLR